MTARLPRDLFRFDVHREVLRRRAGERRRAPVGGSLGQVGCVAIGQVEVASAFHRKFREGTFDARAFRAVMAQFDDDCHAGLWTWLPLTGALAARATAAFVGMPRPLFLRAADALHLVCAQEHGLAEVYTNDRHMSAAARHFRLKPIIVAPR